MNTRRLFITILAGSLLLGTPAFAASIADDAMAAKKAGDFPKAITLFEQALKLEPANLTLLGQLATVQGWAGRYDESLRTYEHALQLSPNDANLRLGRASVLAWAGKHERALAEVGELVADDANNHDAKILWARIHSWRKDYSTAEKTYASVIAAQPDNVDAHEALGDLRRWQDRNQEARDSYERALGISPQYAGLRHKLDSVRRASYRSRVDLDFEHSSFAGHDRADWIDTTGSLHHALSKATGLALTVQQARRFNQSDTQYSAIAGHRFNEAWAGYLGAGVTPADSFLPQRSYTAGGSWKIHEAPDGAPATILLADYRVARYGSGTAQTLFVGPQHHATRRLSGTAHLIASRSLNGDWHTGWLARIDAQPVTGWHGFVGFANATESINASVFDFSAPRRTRAVLAGWAWDLTAVFSVRLDFAHEWADRTPDRNVWHVGTSTRF
jgi:YaiO family outer membrane protein